ncbi:MAG: TetR family transcriptional regulator [Mycobacterium sp.]
MGYRGATVRSIAATAGVDPALISYFFRTKQHLFGEAMALRANSAELIAERIRGLFDELPRRLLTVLLETWDQAENQPALLMIAQTGAGPNGAVLTRGFVEEVLAEPIIERLLHEGVSAHEARIWAALIIIQLVGSSMRATCCRLIPSPRSRETTSSTVTPALNHVVHACTSLMCYRYSAVRS